MADGAQIAQFARETSPNVAPFGDCPRCDKLGFPILPMRFAYVLKDAQYTGQPVDTGPAGYRFNAGELAIRMLSGGYLYLLDERKGGVWRAFHVAEDGALWEFPARTEPDSEGFQCGRVDHLSRSSALVLPDPDEDRTIWMAYVSTRYTSQLLDRGKRALMAGEAGEDEESLRWRTRFSRFDVGTLQTMENSGDLQQRDARLIDAEGVELTTVASEFAGMHARFDEGIVSGCDLRALGRQIGDRMHRMHAGGGAAVFLDDPMGIAMEVRHYARRAAAKIEELETRYARQITVDRAIRQMEASFKNGGAEKAEEWREEYLIKIDADKRQAFLDEYTPIRRRLQGQLEMLGLDTRVAIERVQFSSMSHTDFDSEDPESTVDFVSQMAAVLAGMSLSETERMFALEMIQKPVTDNLMYRVVLADQKALLDYLVQDKAGDVAALMKGSYGVYDEWTKAYSELSQALKASVAGTAMRLDALPEAATALASSDRVFRVTLGPAESVRTMLVTLEGLFTDAKVAAVGNLRVLAMAGGLWFDAYAVPVVETPTWAELVRDNKEAAWGQPISHRHQVQSGRGGARRLQVDLGDYLDELGPDGSRRIAVLRLDLHERQAELVTGTEGNRRSARRRQQREERRAQQKAERQAGRRGRAPARTPLAQAMDEALVGLREEFAQEAARQERMSALEAERARIENARVENARRLGLPPVAGTAGAGAVVVPAHLASLPRAPSGMGWSKRMLTIMRKSADYGGLAALAGAFQAVGLVDAIKELRAKDETSAVAISKVFASVLGVLGAGMEVMAGGMKLAEARTGAQVSVLRMDAKMMAARGAALGGAAGVIMGLLTIKDGMELRSEGDSDAGAYMVLGGFVLAGSGAASIAGAFGLGSFLGPVGWAIAAFVLAGIAIYLLFKSEDARDNPLQVWLRSSMFGTNPLYPNARIEGDALAALFVMRLDVDMRWEDDAGLFGNGALRTPRQAAVVEIHAPAIGRGSWVSYVIIGEASDGFRITYRAEHDLKDEPSANDVRTTWNDGGRERPLTRAAGNVMRRTDRGGIAWRIGGLNRQMRRVTLTLKYWPDRAHAPELVLPDAAGLRGDLVAGGMS
ncbi:hypothetical protein WQ56_09305 [Luteimonas sp. FCS-9]|nr:hypothetical protein WQ56_09305 [Luteimonas sp. FCS-9]